MRAHWLEQAVQAYADIGDSAKVEELKAKLEKAGQEALSELTTISGEVQVDRTAQEQRLRKLLSLGLAEALFALARGEWFVPRIADIRVLAERQRDSHPLQHLMPRKSLNAKGQIVTRAETGDERIAAAELDTYLLVLGFNDLELATMFDELEATRGLDPATLMQFLRAGPFRVETLDTVEVGVERYFSQDYVSAIHVLVPQLEDGLRDILEALGEPRTSMQAGLQREKPLDVVLANDKMTAHLGAYLIKFLEVQLIEPQGPNLRHRTAHGLLKRKDSTRLVSQRLLYCYLLLTRKVLS